MALRNSPQESHWLESDKNLASDWPAKIFYDEIRMLINRWLWKKGRRKFNKTRQNMFDSIRMIACDYCHSESCPIEFRFIFSILKMSSDVVYNCATCSKTVKGKQDYAICVKCSRRVNRKCYDGDLSDSCWTLFYLNFILFKLTLYLIHPNIGNYLKKNPRNCFIIQWI